MFHMVLLVLDNAEQLPDVLAAWEARQVPGITILESTGMGRVRNVIRDDLPLMPSLGRVLRGRKRHHHTIFTVVEDEAVVEALIADTQAITGNLDQAHNGVLFVMPVSRVVGLQGAQARARGEVND